MKLMLFLIPIISSTSQFAVESKLMKKSECIFLNYPDKRGQGGVTCFYASLEEQYSKSKYRIKYFRIGRSYANGLLGFRIIRIFDSVFRYLAFCVEILIARPAILHVNPSTDKKSVLRDSIYIRIAKLISPRTKVLVHFRGWNNRDVDNFNGRGITAKSARYLIQNADHIIVLAEKIRCKLQTFVENEKISVVHTTVDTSRFKMMNSRHRSIHGIQVLFLSRIIEEKGVFEIVRSIKELEQNCISGNLRFLIAGDGPDRIEIQKLLEENDLSQYVEMPGYLYGEAKMNAFSQSSIFLLPTSHGEGCPNALLEAMSAGLAVIATDVGAIGEIIEPEINGLIIPIHDHQAISYSIQRLLRDAYLRENMGKNNIEKVKRIADVNVVFNRITQIYESIL